MKGEGTPPDLREGVRSGIVSAVERDVELRGARTARLLVAAGAIGAVGAIGVTLLIADHPFDHHPDWHVVAFASVWSGLLVVNLALVFLQVRTPSMPLGRSAAIGILGLGLAGICSIACPDQHFLHWWATTPAGARLSAAGGLVLSSLCFGLASTFFIGVISACVGLGLGRGRIRPMLPAAMLLLLLLPGVALQSFDSSWAVFVAWVLGTAAGAYAGIATGIHLRAMVGRA